MTLDEYRSSKAYYEALCPELFNNDDYEVKWHIQTTPAYNPHFNTNPGVEHSKKMNEAVSIVQTICIGEKDGEIETDQ